jgi:hypothetical protein
MIEKLEDIVGELHPEIIADYRLLKQNIRSQKEDNELLGKVMRDLRRENID